MKKRTVIDPKKLSFEPFDNYGEPIKGMSWYKISYDKEKGQGSYILKMDPGSKSVPHEHVNYEEFYMLEGELIDEDGQLFQKGDFVRFETGTQHSSSTKKGCKLLVILSGGKNKLID